ncbi:helix-turn-helix domain-containing protein [Streptosporangium sp. NPDC051022]|uniref:helix-turn-helix domain-containing protein n=1 Tax=Streptosporangium sp. NPDC051022 TaxID=3155752 RepID=UPI003440A3A8
MGDESEIIDPNVAFGAVMRRLREFQKIGLRLFAERLHVNFVHLARWERGERPVPSEMVPVIDEIYGANGVLITLHKIFDQMDSVLRMSDFRRISGSKIGWDACDQNGEGDMERRAVIQLLTALGAGTVLPIDSLETLRSGFGRALGAADGDSLEDWERIAYEHACSIGPLPPTDLIGPLAVDIADLRQVMERHSDLERRGFQRVGAQLAAIMAMALHETGDLWQARRWWRTARSAADSSSDLDLSVWVRGRQAQIECYQPDATVLPLALEAERLANGRPSVGLAEARIAQAKAAHFTAVAMSHGRESATRPAEVLARFDELGSSLPHEAVREKAAIWGWPEERHMGSRVVLGLVLGDDSVYPEIVNRNPEYGPGSGGARRRALNELQKGTCMIKAGEVEQGLNGAATALSSLPVPHRTTAVMWWADQILKSSPQQAQDLDATRELRALTAGPKSA